jgi:hypothetical protein
MNRGRLLHALARRLCSPERCTNVLEPCIADLQRDSDWLAGYRAFWVSLADSLAHDVWERDSRALLGEAAAAFVGMIAMSAVAEAVVMRSPLRAAVRGVPYLYWYALASSATLVWTVPLAIAPAVLYGRRRAPRAAGVAGLTAAAFGVCLTLAASGWIAPAIERAGIVRQHQAFDASTRGRFQTSPLEVDLDRMSTAKSLPNLIRGAFAPPAHRFPGYPNYVAPEDSLAREGHMRDLKFRLLLLLASVLSGIVGLRARSLAWMVTRSKN